MTYLHVRNVEKFRDNFTDGSEKSVRIMEVIELQRFELWKAKYKSFLRKFHGDFVFDRIMEVFELRRFELERLYCIIKKIGKHNFLSHPDPPGYASDRFEL